MIAVYRKQYYGWTKADGCSWLVTFDPSKSDGFDQEDDLWCKKADPKDPEITYIFEVQYSFRCNDPNVPDTIMINADHLDFDGRSVKVEVYKTDLPGWTREDRFTSSKWIPLSELSNVRINFLYHKYQGIFTGVTGVVMAKEIDAEELEKYQKMYKYQNL